jgi:hypothetical protein
MDPVVPNWLTVWPMVTGCVSIVFENDQYLSLRKRETCQIEPATPDRYHLTPRVRLRTCNCRRARCVFRSGDYYLSCPYEDVRISLTHICRDILSVEARPHPDKPKPRDFTSVNLSISTQWF